MSGESRDLERAAGVRTDRAAAAKPQTDESGRLWRALEERAPAGLALSRRELLVGGSTLLGLAGLGGGCTCVPPGAEQVAPLVRDQPELAPGRPLSFATALSRGGHGVGVLVTSAMGHPVKVEGNPDHPSSLGATDIFCQAELDRLYDPDRSQAVRRARVISTFEDLGAALRPVLGELRGQQGRGLYLLTGELSSPTLRRQLAELLRALPGARWHRHEPIGSDSSEAGARIAFGAPLRPELRLDRARVIVALDSDFLFEAPGHLAHARHFSDGRRLWVPGAATASMNRLYVVEPVPTITGASADERLRLRRSEVPAFAVALARALGLAGASGFEAAAGRAARWVAALARDLRRHPGASAVVVGEAQPAAVHALGHAVNEALGNLGRTVLLRDADDGTGAPEAGSLADLARALQAGSVELLLILDSNPAYTGPADLRFEQALRRAKLSVHFGQYLDETGELCGWHVPARHELESFSDLRGHDGTATVLQPLIAPLFGGRSAHELLGFLAGDPLRSELDHVRETWIGSGGLDESGWQRALDRGVVEGTAAPERSARVRQAEVESALQRLAAASPAPRPLELIFRPDPTLWDGRYANVGRLQELQKPVSQLTWESPILVSPATAGRLGLRSEDEVELHHDGRKLVGNIWVQPGQADECVALSLGSGRWRAGRAGDERGLNAYALRRGRALWLDHGVRLRRTGESHRLATTQHHQRLEGRPIILDGEEVHEEELRSRKTATGIESRHSLYPENRYPGRQWGMMIDLTTCIGCNACNIACQVENNIPVVGRKQVLNTREMYWIRVDRYYRGDAADPEILSQPVPCMHCEKAPCEVVCPTGATQHSHDGLNDMVYNRCVGTRYCSNNCPYKVRRFNFYYYLDDETPLLKLARNPEVTVRARGVMEKCTYCVQRIRNAEIEAAVSGRPLEDGRLQTACMQVCPTRTIIFGDLAQKGSRVSELHALPRRYDLLGELNTQPRTAYLTRIRNRNPELA